MTKLKTITLLSGVLFWHLSYALAPQGHSSIKHKLQKRDVKEKGGQKNELQTIKFDAQQGDMYAQNILGFMYEKGQGVEKDEREAVKWFSHAADQGLGEAQHNLGVMYKNGHVAS
jgi:TPR repeat protein